MNPNTVQLIQTVVGALIIAAVLGLARMVMNKADKADVAEIKAGSVNKAEKVELNRVESEGKASVAKVETKLEAALLVVGVAITRPELAEKILALTGRSDDKIQRIVADIVQLNTDGKATAKAAADTDKRLDDLPGRVRTLEENQKRQS